MIKRSGTLIAEEKNVQNGKGEVKFEYMLEVDKGEFYEKGRLFSIITVKPGNSIGYHVHKGEMECYHILAGEGKYDDNGEETTVKPGDTTITKCGEGHSIENVSDTDLVFVALILFTE